MGGRALLAPGRPCLAAPWHPGNMHSRTETMAQRPTTADGDGQAPPDAHPVVLVTKSCPVVLTEAPRLCRPSVRDG